MPKSSFRNTDVTALSTTSNLLSGDVNEFVTYPAEVKIYACSSALGIRMSAFADTDLLIDDKEVVAIATSIDTTAHLVDTFQVAPNTRLAIRLRETANVSTSDVLTAIEINPL